MTTFKRDKIIQLIIGIVYILFGITCLGASIGLFITESLTPIAMFIIGIVVGICCIAFGGYYLYLRNKNKENEVAE